MTARPRILLVDDEVAIQRAVAPLLRSRGYEVEVAGTGADALRMVDAASARPDRARPRPAGYRGHRGLPAHPRAVRRADRRCCRPAAPKPTRCSALDLGADDYVTKPFGPEELLARIRVALRRVAAAGEAETGHLRAGDLTIDYDRRRVVRGDTEIRLTPKEFELLSLLARQHDRVLTHRTILKAIWGGNAVEQPEHLWTLVAQLRKKIEPDPGAPQYLISEPWVGYRFSTGDAPPD